MARRPKKPDAAPKPSKSASAPKPSQIRGKKLARNVTLDNVGPVQTSAGDILEVLRNTGNNNAAVELVRRYASEADPSKPGYEGNEVIAPFVKAFQQLPAGRRQALLDAAGNPPLFADLPQNFDPLAGEALPPRRPTLDEQLMEALAQNAIVPAAQAERQLTATQSPATFGGTKHYQATRGEGRAPIDREVPSTVKDQETGMERPLTEDERLAAEENLIKGIVGPQQYAQYRAIVGPDDKPTGKIPMLPRMGKAGGRPSRAEMDAIEAQNSRTRPAGTSKASMDRIKDEIRRVRGLAVEPDMDPFRHVVDTRIPIDNKELDAIKQMANQEKADVGIDGQRPIQAFLDDVLAGNPINLEERAGLPPELQMGLYGNKMLSDPIFSDEAPTAVPSQQIKDNAIDRLKAQAADIRRRRAAFTENPSAPAIGQAANIEPLTVGTLGLQAPYGKGMTVDQQLARSTQSPNTALMESMYRAFQQMGLADESLDVGSIGEDGIRTVRGTADPRQAFDLNKIPEAFYHYAVPDAEGKLQLSPYAPTAEFLADQMIGRRGIEDPAEFKRIAIPVLEAALASQYRAGPQSIPAMRAASTVLVPNLNRGSKGLEFFSSPEGQAYVRDKMFDPNRPMARLSPTRYTGDMDATLGGPPPMSTEARSLDDLLGMPMSEASQIDLKSLLDQAGDSKALDLDTPNEYKPLDLDAPDDDMPDLDSRFSAMPLRGGSGLTLPMNSARRGPLTGLIA